jgi:hypothetical protein
MKTWFEDPKILVNAEEVLNFWPSKSQTPEDRVNAASRFIIYATSILYIVRRDARIFVLGAMVLAMLYVMHRSGMVMTSKFAQNGRSVAGTDCQLPTRDNPMANPTVVGEDPNKKPACYSPTVAAEIDEFVIDRSVYASGRSRAPHPFQQSRAASRQFVSMPVSTADGGDQTGFAEWLYGAKFQPICRSDQGACDPNARGVQLEAFAGLQPFTNNLR